MSSKQLDSVAVSLNDGPLLPAREELEAPLEGNNDVVPPAQPQPNALGNQPSERAPAQSDGSAEMNERDPGTPSLVPNNSDEGNDDVPHLPPAIEQLLSSAANHTPSAASQPQPQSQSQPQPPDNAVPPPQRRRSLFERVRMVGSGWVSDRPPITAPPPPPPSHRSVSTPSPSLPPPDVPEGDHQPSSLPVPHHHHNNHHGHGLGGRIHSSPSLPIPNERNPLAMDDGGVRYGRVGSEPDADVERCPSPSPSSSSATSTSTDLSSLPSSQHGMDGFLGSSAPARFSAPDPGRLEAAPDFSDHNSHAGRELGRGAKSERSLGAAPGLSSSSSSHRHHHHHHHHHHRMPAEMRRGSAPSVVVVDSIGFGYGSGSLESGHVGEGVGSVPGSHAQMAPLGGSRVAHGAGADRRSRKKDRKRLKRYCDLLQQGIEQKSLHAQNCLLAERNLKERARQGTIALRNAMLFPLAEVFRDMQHTRLCRIQNQREIALHSIILLKVRWADARSILDDPLGLKGDVPPEFFAPVEDVFKAHPMVVHGHELDQLLQEAHARQERLYSTLSRSLAQNNDLAHRSRRLRSLLKNTRSQWVDSGVSFHSWDPQAQSTFNALVQSQAYPEGRLLSQVLKAVEVDEHGDALDQVLPFIQHLQDMLSKAHNIGRELQPTLRLYLCRCVFPLLTTKAFLESQRHHPDAQFRKNQAWMRKLSDAELGVPHPFQSALDGKEYTVASAVLEDVSFHVVPLDILNVIRESARTMFEQAKLVANDVNARIDADSFFPIIIYTCVHAELWDVHSVLHFLNRFASDQEKVVEVGYYLTCLEGAAQYISNATPESIAAHAARKEERGPREGNHVLKFDAKLENYSAQAAEGDDFAAPPPPRPPQPRRASLFDEE